MNHKETIQKINQTIYDLRSVAVKISFAGQRVIHPAAKGAAQYAEDDLKSTIAALESWRGFLEKNGDQVTFEFLHDYDTANSRLVRFLSRLALPAFLESWIYDYLYHRTQKKLARFLAGEKIEEKLRVLGRENL